MTLNRRLNKDRSPLAKSRAKAPAGRRQSRSLPYHARNVAVLGLLAALPACSLKLPDLPSLPTLTRAEPFTGAVVADEPKAAMVGADILTAGGTAADAAVATYFAMAVTLPSSAGLGGGGVCLGYDARTGKSETIEFLPRPTQGGGMSVPTNVRGMAVVHNRWGNQISWARLVTPAESLARNGMPVSRALHQQAGDAGTMATLDSASSRVFLSAAGRIYPEGAILRQIDLATILGRIASRGAGDFYTGPLARQITDSAQQGGLDLTLADLRDAVPRVAPPMAIQWGPNQRFLLPPSPSNGGAIAADLLAMLGHGKFATLDRQARPHLMAEAQARAYAGEAARLQGQTGEVGTDAKAAQLLADFQPGRANMPVGWSIPDGQLPYGAGFAVTDKIGNSVACTYTLVSPMGTGQTLPNTGILVAPAPGGTLASLVPMMVIDPSEKQAVVTVAATGGRAAAAAAVQMALSLTVEEYPLDDAQRRPRMLTDEGTIRLEPDAGDSAAVLRENGHSLTMTPEIGRVNTIHCPVRPSLPGGCARQADPRGAGLATGPNQ